MLHFPSFLPHLSEIGGPTFVAKRAGNYSKGARALLRSLPQALPRTQASEVDACPEAGPGHIDGDEVRLRLIRNLRKGYDVRIVSTTNLTIVGPTVLERPMENEPLHALAKGSDQRVSA